ncbi:hypothetical protein O1M54_04240 [Streptomyces diastatochromogenes]|nr:hypothetical protein [Streptomyces diastatochromogenes]
MIGGRVAPALAARVLTSAAVLTAAATTWTLVLLAAALLGTRRRWCGRPARTGDGWWIRCRR